MISIAIRLDIMCIIKIYLVCNLSIFFFLFFYDVEYITYNVLNYLSQKTIEILGKIEGKNTSFFVSLSFFLHNK